MNGKRSSSEVISTVSAVVGGVMFVVFCAWVWIIITGWTP